MYRKRQCVYCLEDVYRTIDIYQFLYQSPLCSKCLRSFEVLEEKKKWHGHTMIILYRYNDFFRSLLFQYKGLYDIALAPCFLELFHQSYHHIYKDYLFVVLPSSASDNQRRGFCPNQTILECYNYKIFVGLYKERDYKQTSQKDRQLIHQVLKIKDGDQLKGKKIVLFDDVITSGNTLLAATRLIEAYQPSDIKILVLSRK